MIYLIITTSLYNKISGLAEKKEKREIRYVDCIKSLLKLIENDHNIKPIIVENNGITNTHFEKLNCDVVYTNNSSIQFQHKGFNELLDIKHIISKYNIDDNDTVIKLTGRYKILNKYDVFIKFFNVCTLQYMQYDCVMGLFAIKCKYLKKFDFDATNNKSPEVEFATFVKNNIQRNKIMEIENLYLECCFADNLRILYV